MLAAARTLGQYASLQGAAQLLTILAGLIVVRSLPPHEFSLVVLVTAAAGAVQAIGESGLISAVSALGSANYDRGRVAPLLATALHARRPQYLLGILFALPLFPGLASGGDLALQSLAPLWALILLLSHFQLECAIYFAVPRLLLRAQVIAQCQIAGALARLFAVATLFWFRVAEAFWYLAATASAAAFQLWLVRRWTTREVGNDAPKSDDLLAGMRTVTRRQLPNSIFYIFQSQLTVFIAAYFGSSNTVAELGALSRLGLIAGLAILVTNDVIQPKLARRTASRDVKVAHLTLLAALTAGALMAVGVALAFPAEVLWILGASYGHLEAELPLAILATSATTLAGVAYGFNLARGWALPPAIAISTGLGANVLLLLLIDVSTLTGVLLVPTLSGLASIAISSAYTWYRAAGLPK